MAGAKATSSIKDFLKTVQWVVGETAAIEATYDILEQLGQPGTYGTAYRAIHKHSGETRAVKVMEKTYWSQEEWAAVRKEVMVLQKLNDHPNIIKVYEVFETEASLYIVTEICEGGELFDIMVKHKRFKEAQAAVVVAQVLAGLAHLHQHNIVHCDLKPDNFLLVSKKSLDDLKIIDMGMAQPLKPGKWLTDVVGTAYYVAPEVLKQAYNYKSDLFSVGVILYMLVFGSPPFTADDIDGEDIVAQRERGFTPEVKPGPGPHFPLDTPISSQLQDLLAKLLVSDPTQRLNTTQALAHPWLAGFKEKHGCTGGPAFSMAASLRRSSSSRPGSRNSNRSRPNSAQRAESRMSKKREASKKAPKSNKRKIGLKMETVQGEDGSTCVITEVTKDTVAADAGLQEGDVVTRVNGAVVTTVDDFRDLFQKLSSKSGSGGTVKFTCTRDKTPMRVTMEMP